MEHPSSFPYRELADWLRYYRELGFTHLNRKNVPTAEPTGGLTANASWPPADEASPPQSSVPSEASVLSVSSDAFRAALSQPGSLFAGTTPRETLPQIREDLGDCRRCKLWKGRKSIVFGSGNPQAELLFVGEGPGADEDAQGLPFVGRAGQLLTDMIEKGLKIPRPDVYICNIIKCRPPENRKPEKEEVASCRQFVERQIEAVRPRIVVALGATAAETLLSVRESMASLRERWHEFHGIPLLVTYHPAFLLRDPTKKPQAWADLKKVLAYLQAPPSSSTPSEPHG